MGEDGGKDTVSSSSSGGSKVQETDRFTELVLGQEAPVEGFGEWTPGSGAGRAWKTRWPWLYMAPFEYPDLQVVPGSGN